MADIVVVSRVLNLLGRPSVTSIQEDDWAPIINSEADVQNRVILESRTWEFAKKEAVLNLNTKNTNPLWKYKLTLPSDFIRLVSAFTSVGYDDKNIPIVGAPMGMTEYFISDAFYANVDNVLIQYTSSSGSLVKRSYTYIQALAYKTASELAPILLENPNMAAYYNSKYIKYLADARMDDFSSQGAIKRWRYDGVN